MKAIDRQKACPNCSGKIPLDVGQCPYCFAQVPVEAAAKELSTPKNNPAKDNFSAKYTPPYQPKAALESNFLVAEEKKFFSESGEASISNEKSFEKEEGLSINNFWPIFALSVGGNLLVLGILQFFFADHGVVKLEMNAEYWFLFLLLAAPLIYFGLKKLIKE